MPKLVHMPATFSRLLNFRTGHLQTPRHKASEVLDALEQAVKVANPAIRLIPGYRRKLRAVVGCALSHIDNLTAGIPGPIEFSRRTFATDPRVNAFFANIDDLQTALAGSFELRDFLRSGATQWTTECHALLCMKRTERKALGVELRGDVVREDVLQTTVSFSDHQINTPAAAESDARAGLKRNLFGGLITMALEQIAFHRQEAYRLHREYHRLRAELRRLAGLRESADGKSGAKIQDGIEAVMKQIAQNDKARKDKDPAGPSDSLEQLRQVLSHPEDYIRLNTTSLRLTKLGIKVNEDSHQSAEKLDLAEVQIGDSDGRVALFAKFPRDECHLPGDSLSRYLRM